MKTISYLTSAIIVIGAAVSSSPCIAAAPIKSVEEIADRLTSMPDYKADATFRVSMEQLSDDIIYQLRLWQQLSQADPFDTDSYIIDWTASGHPGNNKGFSAYYSGNHFRYANQRLQEYHAQWDSIPFAPAIAGLNSPGIQQSAQFFNILPQAIAADLRKIISDTAYSHTFQPDTLIGGKRAAVFHAKMTVNGTTACENIYTFNHETATPVRIHIENNPGTISEQTVDVVFSNTSVTDNVQPIDEKLLTERYADIFANYRTANMTLEKLVGRQLPRFSLPTTTGQRYSRRASDPLRCPAIVVLAEAENETTPSLISDIRSAIGRLQRPAQIIWAFTDNVADRIEPIIGEAYQNETILMGAHPLIRDCGATSLPAAIVVDSDGKVKNVIARFNNDTLSDVIQIMTDVIDPD